MSALLVFLVLVGTASLSVAFGVFSAYFVVTGLLAACNPSRPSMPRTALVLVPRESPAIGD